MERRDLPQSYHNGNFYHPIDPTPDQDKYRNRKRLILRHTRNGIELKWHQGELTSGWVIGLSSALE